MGSDQRKTIADTDGFGPEVRDFRNALRGSLVSIGSFDLEEQWLDYPAHSTDRLSSPHLSEQDLYGYWQRARSYFDGMDQGVNQVVSQLKSTTCKDQQIVLAGYSQGAMVMQRAVAKLRDQGRKDILNRVAGLVLYGNGDRPPDTGTRLEGDPAAGVGGQGIAQAFGSHPQVPQMLQERTWDICTKNDLVCDWRGAWSAKHKSEALDVHSTYRKFKRNKDTADYLAIYIKTKLRATAGCLALDNRPRALTAPAWVGEPRLVPTNSPTGSSTTITGSFQNRDPAARAIKSQTAIVVQTAPNWGACDYYYHAAVTVASGNPTIGLSTFTDRNLGSWWPPRRDKTAFGCTVLTTGAYWGRVSALSTPKCFFGDGTVAPTIQVFY